MRADVQEPALFTLPLQLCLADEEQLFANGSHVNRGDLARKTAVH